MGAGTWEMFDHNVPWDFSVSASGLADIYRREKPSFWFFESQFSKKPFLKMAADWQRDSSTRRVVVFTNSSSVSLMLNGRIIATGRPERSPSAAYDLSRAWGPTDTVNLLHPPVIFNDVEFKPGTLKAIGDDGASDEVGAVNATKLKMWIDDLGVPVTADDLVFLRVAVVDRDGHVSADGPWRAKFSVNGAQIVGSAYATPEMGVASVLIRTPAKLARIVPSVEVTFTAP